MFDVINNVNISYIANRDIILKNERIERLLNSRIYVQILISQMYFVLYSLNIKLY